MKFLIAGDFYVNKNSEFSIEALNETINGHDYFLINSESPILHSDSINPASKSGPNMFMDADTLNPLLKYKEKLIMSGANNHLGDFGEDGVMSTLNYFQKHNILHVGCGHNSEEAFKPLILEGNIALVAMAENEFGMSNETKAGANPLRVEVNLMQVLNLARNGYRVIVYFHGGNEESPIPNPFIKRLYRSFIEAGAKVVIGNHTHCRQGYEAYQNGIIFYSLGNFVFDEPEDHGGLKDYLKQKIKTYIKGEEPPTFWNIGYLVSLDLSDEKPDYKMIPVTYDDHKLHVMDTEQKKHFVSYMEHLNSINNNKEAYHDLWNRWTFFKSSLVQKKIDSFSYHKTDQQYGKFLAFRNQITCESHRELLMNLNALIEGHKLEEYHDISTIRFLQNPENFGI